MNASTIIGVVVTLGIAMGIFFAVDAVQGKEFNWVDKLVQIVVVLVVVALAGWVAQKGLHVKPIPAVKARA